MVQFEIQKLNFSYPTSPQRKTLDDVTLQVHAGDYIVVCGKSGSGKTTLLRHLKSVLTPHGQRSGSVCYCGVPLEQVGQREQAAQIGFVMQNPDDQIVTDKVWHELAFGLESLGVDQKTMRLRVAEMACYFGIQDWFHRDVSLLSGGQKQLLNLASIMAMQPQVLILDEPTSQLDPIAAADFLGTVRKINLELGTTVIISEHRLEDIFPVADRAIVMEQGRILVDAAPREVGALLWERKNAMFHAMPAPVRVFYAAGGHGQCPLTVREGRNWLENACKALPSNRALPPEEPLPEEPQLALQVKEAWFRYEKDAPDVLRGICVAVPKGSLYAIVGGNGAGKSTLLRMVCNLCRPYRGSVRLFGQPLNKFRSGELFHGNLAMLPQDPKSLFSRKRVAEELEEMSPDSARRAEVAQLCGIEELLEAHPYDLSGGEQQRVALAKVLLTEPKLLLLDEPTKGMDSFFKDRFAQILRELQRGGVTVVMVSHDVEFCARYADSVSMLFDGQILTTDTPRRFFGQNSFYTTVASRMSRGVFSNAVTAQDVVWLLQQNQAGGADDAD